MDTTDNINTGNAQEKPQQEFLIGADRELDAYIGMALRRHKDSAADVDAEWQSFRSANMATLRGRRKTAVLRTLLSAAVGAAAMFVFLFMFHDKVFNASSTGGETVAVAAKKAAPNDGNATTKAKKPQGSVVADTASTTPPATPIVVAKAEKNSHQPQRITTPAGMDLRVTLSDGSEVWLNAGSTLDFPSSFMASERRVKLQGEAYFKVAKNPQKPFIVTSNQMQVRVLGTEFNFKSYSSEPAAVTLINGKVEIVSQETEKAVATLSPGEEAWYDKNGEICIADADTYAVTQWVKGYFYFRDKPLVNVLRELGRWYGLGVVFNNPKAMDYKVHFSAQRNAPIRSALESLNRLKRVTVDVENGNIVVY